MEESSCEATLFFLCFSITPLFAGMRLFPAFHRVHTLNTVNASLSHGFTAANMGASEGTSRLQKHLDAQKQY